MATGSEETTPATADTGVSDERGRWTVAEGFPSIERQSYLDGKATWLVDEASTVENAWTARLTSGTVAQDGTVTPTWGGRDHLWIGDTVTLAVKSGREQVDGPHRVVELQAVPGEHGSESITVGLVEIEEGS